MSKTNVSLKNITARYDVNTDTRSRLRVPSFAASLVGLKAGDNAYIAPNKSGKSINVSKNPTKTSVAAKVEYDGSIRFDPSKLGFKNKHYSLVAESGSVASFTPRSK